MPSAPPRLHLPDPLRRQLWGHAQAQAPEECVGVLAGWEVEGGWQADAYAPLPNVAPRPQVQYQADPAALIRVLRGFREQELELVGIFHSHPRGPSMPSPADIAAAGYDVPYLIADLSAASLRAFLLPHIQEIRLTSGPNE